MENILSVDENEPSVSSLLSEILKKYGLDEDIEKIAEKLEKDEPVNLEIINSIADDFENNKISAQDFPPSLQRDFNIPEETAKKMAADIINVVIPMLKKITAKKMANAHSRKEEIKADATKIEAMRVPQIPKKNERVLPGKIKNTSREQKKGPDSYREPIE